jgi:hypothetical protein
MPLRNQETFNGEGLRQQRLDPSPFVIKRKQ